MRVQSLTSPNRNQPLPISVPLMHMQRRWRQATLFAGQWMWEASSSNDPPPPPGRRPKRSETQYRRNVRHQIPFDAAARAAGMVGRLTREEVAAMQEMAPSRFELRLEERSQSALKELVHSPDSLAEVLPAGFTARQNYRGTGAARQRGPQGRS